MSCVSKGIGNQPKQTVPGAPIKKLFNEHSYDLRAIGTEQITSDNSLCNFTNNQSDFVPLDPQNTPTVTIYPSPHLNKPIDTQILSVIVFLFFLFKAV